MASVSSASKAWKARHLASLPNTVDVMLVSARNEEALKLRWTSVLGYVEARISHAPSKGVTCLSDVLLGWGSALLPELNHDRYELVAAVRVNRPHFGEVPAERCRVEGPPLKHSAFVQHGTVNLLSVFRPLDVGTLLPETLSVCKHGPLILGESQDTVAEHVH